MFQSLLFLLFTVSVSPPDTGYLFAKQQQPQQEIVYTSTIGKLCQFRELFTKPISSPEKFTLPLTTQHLFSQQTREWVNDVISGKSNSTDLFYFSRAPPFFSESISS